MPLLNSSIIVLPLALIVLGTMIAALGGLPGLNPRLNITRFSYFLALFPLASFIVLASLIPRLDTAEVLVWRVAWIPVLDLSLGFYVDNFAVLFGLIVTFIGVLVIVYGGQYFKGDASAWRFQTYMLLFMASMLGLVLAGDVLTLFIFWELTSIVSFLLIAYKTKDEAARRGAFRALFITGGGGIALLAGLLFVSFVAGSTQYTTILSSSDVLRSSWLYPVMLGLVAFGAMTKSAQFPAHIWLPGAMSAPTPASAYLHSATMVKAGIYLMARLNPALGGTESWFWLLTVFGLLTMLAGAYLGFKQNDLKALLAYSTVSQLGILMMLIGQDIGEAYKALIIGIVAHALYKSSLFMVAGIVDHETGTRDMRRLGGLRRVMPYTFVVALVAALSMAGLPPLFGFLAKETLLAAAIHPTLPPLISTLLPLASVLAGALILAQAALFIRETFLGKPKDPTIHGHEAPRVMWLMPAIPAFVSVAFSLVPGVGEEAVFLAGAASDAFGDKVKVSLALWHGINIPLVLSMIAIALGSAIFVFRRPIRAWQTRVAPELSFEQLYRGVMAGIFRGGRAVTRLQTGRLRTYMLIMVAAALGLVVLFAQGSLIPDLTRMTLPPADLSGAIQFLRLFALLVAVGAALATVLLHRDFAAVLALAASGLSMALLFVLEPAPDVALVQIVVDILATVILVLALARLPRGQRAAAQRLSETEMRGRRKAGLVRDLTVAGAAGLVVALMTYTALSTRPLRTSAVTPYYEVNAKSETGASDIVGAIVVDYRQLDTVIEIVVFSAAGLGAYMLLRLAGPRSGDKGRQFDDLPRPTVAWRTMGIGGPNTSAIIRVPTFATLPTAMLIAATHIIYGHQQPGDGFTAGVIVALAAALWYIVFGYEETRRRLPWLRGIPLIGAGVLIVLITGGLSFLLTGSYFGHVDFGKMIGLPLPRGFDLSSSFLFEVAICLTVLGSSAAIISTLGHPGEEDIAAG